MSYVPNNLSESDLSDIKAAIEAAIIHANRLQHPVVLRDNLTSVAMTYDNATMGLEVIQPDELKYVG
tara:strand:- start:856 stop:1056 length:201 start_codon:yes stop_codon:yes gene_type:complete